MTDEEQVAADEHFVRVYTESCRAAAERAARIQVARAAEWRRRADAGEWVPLNPRDGSSYSRLYPDHDYATAYSGIALWTVGAIYQNHAHSREPQP